MKRAQISVTNTLNRLHRWQLIMGSSALLTAIWGIDYFIKVDLGLSIFYVIPIMAFAWYISPKSGYTASGVSASLWFIAEWQRTQDAELIFIGWNTLVRLAFFVLIVALLSELKVTYRQEKALARTDTLTSLLNRRAFLEILTHEVQRSRRHQLIFTLAYLDVDNFKEVNDRLGHATGDRLLQAIATLLLREIRITDYQGRLGGDEFAILMPQTDQEQAYLVLTRLFTELLKLNNSVVEIGFSIGAVTFQTAPETADKALLLADKLMYTVKAEGKNRLAQDVYRSLESLNKAV